MKLLDFGLSTLGAAIATGSGYLLLFTLLSARPREPAYGTPKHRFRIIVPAHNEQEGIAATVSSLLDLDYPRELYDVQVVADNCSDETARRAEEAGASVLIRSNERLRGKGYALLHAFEALPDDLDTAMVIDADTVVSKNLLRAFAARLDVGAGAVQADYAVRNPNQTWRTRLIAIAFGSFHVVRSRARERLGLSCGLRGNGMCFTRNVLKNVPHQAFSIVEDVEYGIRLGEAGYRVHYADEAHVYGEMVSTGAAARSQRQRWEGGRRALARAHGARLLRQAWTRRDPVLLDLAFDVLIPPLSVLSSASLIGLLVSAAASAFGGGFGLSRALFGFSSASLAAYVLRGWMVSGTGLRGLMTLAASPVYVVWKVAVRRERAAGEGEWVRTRREQESEKSALG